ncbi:YwiC-like family protein [Streptomyces sp. NPDC093105]|uniref:YwiC-like family protein n=1 Tax=Streptomyces sp. NPDC093105 TaxID=3366029 RepID=UPI0038069D5A
MCEAGPVSTLRRWIPNQHGAWAMLVVPVLAGVLTGSPTWLQLPLFLAWLLGYCAVFHIEQWVRLRHASRNPRAAARHLRPALVLAGATAALGLPLLVAAPWLGVAAALMAPFLAVNVVFARRNRERALVNGLAAVVPACGMLLVALRLGGGATADGLAPAAACLLYFAGTVPYVKTMIRERNSAAYRRGSVAYHAVALVAATLLDPWLAVPFAVYLARAAVLPGRGIRVPVVGAVEVGCSLLLLGFLVGVYG